METKTDVAVMNYDPNMTLCGRMAKQTVRLTFGTWTARLTVEEVVGGNCTGLTVIETAVANFYEKLPGGDFPVIVLNKPDGDTLECCDEEQEGEEWLQNMLVSAEIVSIAPNGRWTSRAKSGEEE